MPFAGSKNGQPLPYPLSVRGARYFYLARSGIYHAARTLTPGGGAVAMVPDYHNGLEVLALRAAGVSPRFYRIDRRMNPDLDAIRRGLREGARLVLAIHFNGWPQPVEEMRSLCREHGAALLEDCALAFLSGREDAPLGTTGDASVFCLYKTLPIPHGAVLAMKGEAQASLAELSLRRPGALSTIARSADLAIVRIRSRADRLGAVLEQIKSAVGGTLSAAGVSRAPVGSMQFDPTVLDLAMSPWVAGLLHRFDYTAIRARRRANFTRLLSLLVGSATPLFTSLPDDVCPLFFPLLVGDKRSAVRTLTAHGIGAVEFWNSGDPEAEGDCSADALALRRHVIELPIHQDLGEEQIDFIARTVLSERLRFTETW